jgi:transposase
LRQVHVAGEKLFVDYSGHTMEVIDALTGEVLTAQIFVAVLGASNYTYAEATFTQSLPDRISSHVRAFAYFGGVAQQTVPDYVSGHIIGLMCRSALCGRASRQPVSAGACESWGQHNPRSKRRCNHVPVNTERRLSCWNGIS